MVNSNFKKYSTILYVIFAIFTARVLRQIGFQLENPLKLYLVILRASIYIGLFTAWCISVRNRIIQPQVRRYLTVISALMAFWMTVRTIRYSLGECMWLMRYLWYLYYLPMLFISSLSVFVSLSLGKPDNFRLPKWTKFLYIPTAALLMLVLTNDLHQLVFVFPKDAVIWGNDYHYAFGYFLVIGYIVVCIITTLITMLIKCRIPHRRNVLMLPIIPMALAVFYSVLYIFRVSWLRTIAGDVTVVFCLLIMAALENCIRCGLIQSNTGYDELFMASRLGAQITNQENVVCLVSANTRELTQAQRISAGTRPVLVDQTILVKSQPIRFGHALWQVDIAEIMDTIEQVEENCRNLAERNRIRQENLKTRKKLLSLQEKNRVSDLLHRETASQIDLIDWMLAQYDMETDDRKRKRLLGGAAVVGAYIKRYGNLLLIDERTEIADICDLSRCFDESFINLELLGVNCVHTLPSGISLVTKDMLKVYRNFEMAVETSLSDLQYVWVNIRENKEEILLNMEFVCDTDLSHLASMANAFSSEDGAYRFTFKLRKGGE